MNLSRIPKGYAFVEVLVGLLCIVLGSQLCRQPAPWNITFVRMSKGQRFEFYHRNRKDPVIGGHILSKAQAKFPQLAKLGWGDNRVKRIRMGTDPDKIRLMFGVDGYFPEYDEFGAAFVTGAERFPAKVGKWSWKDKEEHMIFLTSPSFETLPRSGAFEITNRHSGVTLFTYKF